MSLESGRKLGLISSLMFVILPIISIGLTVGFLASIISTAISLGSNANPAAIVAASAGLGVTLVVVGVLSFVALVLFVVAMYYLSHYYNDRGIYTNVLYAVIMNLVTAGVLLVAEFAFIIPGLATISPSTTPSAELFSGYFLVLIAFAIAAVVVAIVGSVLFMRAFNKLGERSGVDSFKTAGLLYLIGLLLSIVVVGVIIAWIGFIFAAVGFYRLKPLPAPVAAPAYTSQPSTLEQRKICPYCGTENIAASMYCRNCGKPI